MKAAAKWLAANLLWSLSPTVMGATLFVDLNNPVPLAPYTNWLTAATNIQDAVNAAEAGSLILVNNGVYQAGAQSVYGTSNRVALTQAVTVQSVNGPGVTIISGSGPAGPTAVRCVYLTNGAVLAGFTLTNGATQTAGDVYQQQSGGGVWCESESAVLLDCILVSNAASFAAGAAYQGSLYNCTLSTNSAFLGGGAYAGALYSCRVGWNAASYGGGAYGCALNQCLLSGNNAGSFGGGISGGTVNNSLLTGNSAGQGGGAYDGMLNNCTVSSNSAAYGGGVSGGTVNNSIIYFNTASTGPNTDTDLAYGSEVRYCCTLPLTIGGIDNFSNAPLFVDPANGNWRLQANSPCINSGLNAYAPGFSDLDGNPRIKGGTVDVGAYEFQTPASVISYGWLEAYLLPTDGSADYADPDGDGMNNWQEWMAGTSPIDAGSVLQLEAPLWSPPGVLLTWTSDTNHAYFVERAESLRAPVSFQLLQQDIAGLAGVTAYVDAGPLASSGTFYRVGTGTSNNASPPTLQQPVPVPGMVTLTWASVSDRTYDVLRATNLVGPPAFEALETNIAGLAGTTSYMDTNTPALGQAFYRLNVRR